MRPSDLLIDPYKVKDEWLKSAEMNLEKGYQEYIIEKYKFKDDTIGQLKLRIVYPNQDSDFAVSQAYSEKYSKLLDSDMKTWTELKQKLTDRGIWTAAEEKKYINQRQLIETTAFDVAKYVRSHGLDKPELTDEEQALFEKKRQKYDVLTIELDALNLKRYQLYYQSIEGQASQYAQNVKAIHCILIEKDGEWVRLWDSMDSFKNEKAYNKDAVASMLGEAVMFWSGISQEILQYLPSGDIGEGITKDVSS